MTQTEPTYGTSHLTGVMPTSTVGSVEEDIARIDAKLDELIRLVNVVVDNVKPALDAMASSPLGVMFGMRD